MSGQLSDSIYFVKGHCGWDVVTLVFEEAVGDDDRLAASLKMLDPPVSGGLEIGWLARCDDTGTIRLRMVNSTTRSWIPMCGGMTQVIGKALVETGLGARLQVDAGPSPLTVTLDTPSGMIPLVVHHDGKRVAEVVTVMDRYLDHVAELGIEAVSLLGVDLLRVGKYAVIDIAALKRRHPGIDFTRRDPGPHLDIVNAVLGAFRARQGVAGVNGMLYDACASRADRFRVFPRFLSDDMIAARIPSEFQCGTGGIAVAAALVAQRLLSAANRKTLVLEWGNPQAHADPYGVRTSELMLIIEGDHLTGAAFSHSTVEIIAEGQLRLPAY